MRGAGLTESSYLLSLLIPKNLVGRSLSEVFTCDTTSLRGVNALALAALAKFALLSRWQIEACLHGARHSTKLKTPSQYAIHSALNIALCPVIFFFSGLYYTDVASTVVVLAAFLNSLQRMGRDRSSFLSDLLSILLGLLALFMRQTNVFWVVVFLGGLEAIHAVKTLSPQRVDEPSIDTVLGRVKYFIWRYSIGDVHDPPSHVAWEHGKRAPTETLGVHSQSIRYALYRSQSPRCSNLQSIAYLEADLAAYFSTGIICFLYCLERRCCPR